MPVDLYVGGAEHAVLHLLYSRFWHKFLYDIKVVSTLEPFQKLRNVGLVLAPDGQKMSKSKGNVIAPEEIADEFGADTLRVYEMFMGPFDQAIGWNTNGVKGVNRFLNKAWDLIIENKDLETSSSAVISETEKLVKKVEEDIAKMKFNTCIAFFMEYINFVSEKKSEFGKDAIKKFLVIFSPFAPHFAEELWEILGQKPSITAEAWPSVNTEAIIKSKTILVVQVNGKVRDKIEIEGEVAKDEALGLCEQNPKVSQWINGKQIKEVVFVPNKIINIVTE
jgi:leucyl-tRNA synthetase